MLAALLADDCLISSYNNYTQNSCLTPNNPYCVHGAANSLSFVANSPISFPQTLIAVVSFLVQLTLLIMMRITQNGLTIYYSERTCKISDFTLRVKYIPKNYKNNKQRV